MLIGGIYVRDEAGEIKKRRGEKEEGAKRQGEEKSIRRGEKDKEGRKRHQGGKKTLRWDLIFEHERRWQKESRESRIGQ